MNRPLLQKLGIVALFFCGLWLTARYLLPIILPFAVAAALAFLAEPLVAVLQRRLHLPRGAATGIGVSLTLLLAVLIVLTLCALLVRQLGKLAFVLPDVGNTALAGIHSLEGFLVNLTEKAPDSISPLLTNGVTGFFSDSTMVVNQLSTRLLSMASGVVTRIPDGALGLGTGILACFMISAKLPQLRLWFSKKVPSRFQEQYLPAAKRLKKNLGGWLIAQAELMGVTFLILCAGFFLLRISHSPVWAFLISLVDALPVLGTGTVLLPWCLVCLLQGDHVRAIGLLGVYLAAALIRSVLEPKLVGKQLGLDPLVTLLAMYTGYRLWGIFGMLLSPLLAITATQLLHHEKP